MYNIKIGSEEWEFDCLLTKTSSKGGYLREILDTTNDWK